MTEYSGNRSLDAEIKVDFIKGDVTMDYSLNKFGSSQESNTSTVLNDTYSEVSLVQRAIDYAKFAGITLIGVPLMLSMPVHTVLSEHKIITDPHLHYKYQELIKNICINIGGYAEQSRSGELLDPVLKFKIAHNLWLEYELNGEYQDKIKSISLKRHFIKIYKFGKYPRQQQSGWDVIFEFTEPLKSGSCILRSC